MPQVFQQDIEHVGPDLFFVAASPATRKLRTQAELLSQTDVPVLITGEAGSGKQLVARLIHGLSIRSGFSFLAVDCGAISAASLERDLFGYEAAGNGHTGETRLGKFDLASKGTILLENFDKATRELQLRLLRFLSRHEFVRCGSETPSHSDARVMVSTSANLEQRVADQLLEEALYRRLCAFHAQVPPLRERREEIPLLLGHFLGRLARRYGVPERLFSADLLQACQEHSWPGNLRELEDFAKRYLALGNEDLALADVKKGWLSGPDLGEQSPGEGKASHAATNGLSIAPDQAKASLKSLVRSAKGETERGAIVLALEETRWNRKAAAQLLGISYRALLYKIKEYNLSPLPPRAGEGGTRSVRLGLDVANGQRRGVSS
jgi:two-component system response regulator AtoC